ncbi:MAG: hypothetical protein ACLFRP_09280 [Puniceicoccaceae bacterium]
MQKITIDLPEANRRLNLPADQWKALKQWMEEEQINHKEMPPDETALKTDEETSVVYRITGNHQKVLDFLED